MSIRLFIADTCVLTRRGIRAMLSETDIDVVGEATDGPTAVEKTLQLKPDVVLLEVRLIDKDGLWAAEQIRSKFPQARIVIFSAFETPNYVAHGIALGINNYLSKTCPNEELKNAIVAAMAGETANGESLLPPIAQLMFERIDGRSKGYPLTKREFQILRLLALGLSNKLISQCLHISIETVKEHVQNILRKLEMRDRTEAAVFAVRNGIV